MTAIGISNGPDGPLDALGAAVAGDGEPGTVTAGALADGASLPLCALLVHDALTRSTAARRSSMRRGGDIGSDGRRSVPGGTAARLQ
ncbi:MAG: hypothetical protein ABI534_06150 [Chloroflexota bacterium]